MSTKVELASGHTQSTITASTAAAAATGSKISKFATKSGFVIPKNKLSGSLVPTFRGGKKGGNDTENEEGTKQVQRKTKWGPDLTQDTAVRKGRALAYQTRVDQITQQLSLGTLETRDSQDASSAAQIQDHDSSNSVLNTEESECLELEMREAIGEILKLNPSYKAPADYKPLLKEAKVPIPIKDYPGYNVIGLLFGPGNDTQKRLVKETGATIRVYGTKVDTGEKAEVTASDGDEMHVSFEELHVHVSADTCEKVDAAVALIELLVTPVSVNAAAVSTTPTKVSADNMNIVALSQGAPAALVSQAVTQQNNLQQYAGPWFPVGATQTTMFPSLGFTAHANPSAPLVSNHMQVPSSSLNHSNMPSIFGPRPVETALGSVPQNPSLVPSGLLPPQFLQHPYMPQPHPRNLSMPVSQPTPLPNFTSTPQLSANQPMPTWHSPIVRPGLPSFPQSSSPALFSNQPLVSSGGSAGWSQPLLSTPSSLGPGNMISRPPALTVLQGHLPMASQPIAVSGAPPRNLSPLSQPSASHLAGVNQPIGAPPFNSVSHSQMGPSFSLLPSSASGPAPPLIQTTAIAPVRPSMPHVSMPASSPNPVLGSTPVLSPITSTLRPPPPQSGDPNSVPGSVLRFDHMAPPFVTAPRPQQPSSSDFTFQPHRPQNPAPQMAHGPPSNQPIRTHPNQSVQPPQGSQNPFSRPAMHNLNPSPVFQGFSRPQVGNQMSLPRAQTPVNQSGGPTPHPGAVRHATYPNNSAVSPTAVSLLQPRNFISSPQIGPSAGSSIPRAGPMQIQQNYPPMVTRPRGLIAPNHQFNSNIPFLPAGRPASSSLGVQQIYDPFSPTSASLNSRLISDRAKMEKQENDPEYEDLMASVGVK